MNRVHRPPVPPPRPPATLVKESLSRFQLPKVDCSICQETTDKKPRFILECGHEFHINCLLGYISSAPSQAKRCAMCRRDTTLPQLMEEGNVMQVSRAVHETEEKLRRRIRQLQRQVQQYLPRSQRINGFRVGRISTFINVPQNRRRHTPDPDSPITPPRGPDLYERKHRDDSGTTATTTTTGLPDMIGLSWDETQSILSALPPEEAAILQSLYLQ